ATAARRDALAPDAGEAFPPRPRPHPAARDRARRGATGDAVAGRDGSADEARRPGSGILQCRAFRDRVPPGGRRDADRISRATSRTPRASADHAETRWRDAGLN